MLFLWLCWIGVWCVFIVAWVATLCCWKLMCLSVYVEPHLPRVRSLRIFDSLRAIIAFREACDPPFVDWYLWIWNWNVEWCVIVLAIFMFSKGNCIEREIVWFVKIFSHPSITLIIEHWVCQRHRAGGQVECMCAFLFVFCTNNPVRAGNTSKRSPAKVKAREIHLTAHVCLGTRV